MAVGSARIGRYSFVAEGVSRGVALLVLERYAGQGITVTTPSGIMNIVLRTVATTIETVELEIRPPLAWASQSTREVHRPGEEMVVKDPLSIANVKIHILSLRSGGGGAGAARLGIEA